MPPSSRRNTVSTATIDTMSIQLDEMSWEITDDVAWTKEWVGLSRGDIYRDDQPYGHYVAAWYPNTARDMVMIVTVLGTELKPVLSIGVRCSRGDLSSIAAVEPEEIPWESDGVLVGPVTRLEEFSSFSQAREALIVAAEIVELDASLRKYICQKD